MKAYTQNQTTTKQPLADLFKANYQNLNKTTLRDIAYIGYIVSEQGGCQPTDCQSIYQQLMHWEFKATAQNIDEFSHLLADLVDIAIENLRLINYGTLDNPYYREAFFNALELILPTTEEATRIRDDLVAKFSRGWKTLPQKQNPLAEEAAQQFAHTLQKNYNDYRLRSHEDRQTLIRNWQNLVTLGKTFYENQINPLSHEYAIHYQQFADYAAQDFNQLSIHLAALTYSVARMVELATQLPTCANYHPNYAPFIAAIEIALGHKK